MHRSARGTRTSEEYLEDWLPTYDPQSEVGKRAARRKRMAESMVHAIPFVLIVCGILLWFFSHPGAATCRSTYRTRTSLFLRELPSSLYNRNTFVKVPRCSGSSSSHISSEYSKASLDEDKVQKFGVLMMRFKKGCKVEVLNQREVPSGSWRSAEILWGNGHNYYVKYDVCSVDIGASVERVPRKVLRPCPPLVKGPTSWVPGDIVEVFEDGSWKIADVSRVVGRGYFIVRFLGSSRRFRVHASDLRLRQSWQDNKWVVIGQDFRKSNDGKRIEPSKEDNISLYKFQQCSEVKQHAGDENLIQSDACFVEPFCGFSRGVKRIHDTCLLPYERHVGSGRKKKAVGNEGWCQGGVAGHTARLLEKVDAVVSPRKMLGENYMHTSLNNRTIGISEMDPGRADECIFLRSLSHDDAESVSSSVGSCSISNDQYRLTPHPITGVSEDLGNYSDDADSFPGSGGEPSPPTKNALAEEIHCLELHAYRSTMTALHASGPISWEQEALLTNLRLMLHISNDEHLVELKHLVSAETNTPLR